MPGLPGCVPRRIAVFYPWSDFDRRQSGASRRVSLLLDVLVPSCEEVRVLHAGRGGIAREGRLVSIAAPRPPRGIFLVRLLLRFLAPCVLGRGGWGQVLPLWWYLERLADRRFRAEVRALVRWADAVLLEYGFWAAIVAPECRRQGVPLILTDHDVIAAQVTRSRLLHRLALGREIAAMRAATHAVCVTAADAAVFAADGIETEVIANPTDLGATALAARPPRALLDEQFGIAHTEAPICLFVGSAHPPNTEAVARVRALAQRMAGPAAPRFVLAGSCAPRGMEGGVLALGVIEAAALADLYRLAALVLVPLGQGTGSSLKTLEAFAWSRPVLGTAVAFRGLPVTHGVDCIVEDDLACWPAAIAALLGDAPRREAIGAAARRLAENFDHRRVFVTYLRLLGLPDAAAGPAHSRAAPE
jgi:glycosyltransferase involved in cell wall biosynthesis